MGIVRSTHRGGTVVQLAKVNPFNTAVNQLPQSPQDSLIDLAVERLLTSLQLLLKMFLNGLRVLTKLQHTMTGMIKNSCN